MRVAFVTPFFPWPPDTGGKLRSYYLLKGLSAVADVDFYTVCYGPPPAATPLADICRSVEIVQLEPRSPRSEQIAALVSAQPRSVRYFQTAESLRHMRQRLQQPYDLFVCDEIGLADYLVQIPGKERTPRIMMRQKVDHLHYRETAHSRPWNRDKVLDMLEARRLKRYEETMMPHFQGAVVCSQEDGAVIGAQGENLTLRVIVNGADTDYFTPQRQPDAHPTILLLGTMHYYPNIDAVLYFFETIYPRLKASQPDVQILIVGHLPPPEIRALERYPGVTVTGSVPDVRPYMARSWIMAVPLRLGGGTRLKIVESMAAGLPVVSTSVGAQGLTVTNGVQLMMADAPQDFADQCVALLNNPRQRTEMATLGRTFVEESYSWQSLGRQFGEFCHTIAGMPMP